MKNYALAKVEIKLLFAYHMINESPDSLGEIPSPYIILTIRLWSEKQNSISKIYMYYKLGQACVTTWGSFVLLRIRANFVTNWGSFIITNQGKCCYKLRQLLQIRATVIIEQGSCYKLGQNVLQIGANITNQGNYYKLGHNRVFPVPTGGVGIG